MNYLGTLFAIYSTVLALVAIPAKADDARRVHEFVEIWNGRTTLTENNGAIMFFAQPVPPTWNLTFNGGLSITKIVGSGDGRSLLGVDPKTKKVAMFKKLGESTTWQFKSATDEKIPRKIPFQGTIYMKLGDEVLWLSSDAEGHPILGKKADTLTFRIDGK